MYLSGAGIKQEQIESQLNMKRDAQFTIPDLQGEEHGRSLSKGNVT